MNDRLVSAEDGGDDAGLPARISAGAGANSADADAPAGEDDDAVGLHDLPRSRIQPGPSQPRVTSAQPAKVVSCPS